MNKRRLLASESRKRSLKLRSKLRKKRLKRKEQKIKLMLKLVVRSIRRNPKRRKTRRRNPKRKRKTRKVREMISVAMRKIKSYQAKRESAINQRKMLKSLIQRSSFRMSQNSKEMTKIGSKARKMRLVMKK